MSFQTCFLTVMLLVIGMSYGCQSRPLHKAKKPPSYMVYRMFWFNRKVENRTPKPIPRSIRPFVHRISIESSASGTIGTLPKKKWKHPSSAPKQKERSVSTEQATTQPSSQPIHP